MSFLFETLNLMCFLVHFGADQTLALPASIGSLAWAGSGSGVIACGLEDGSIHLLQVRCFLESDFFCILTRQSSRR
jgi:hypothetical protein